MHGKHAVSLDGAWLTQRGGLAARKQDRLT
jgi:hypothetical protein